MLVCKKCKNTKLEGKWVPTHNLRKNVTFTLCPTCSDELKLVSRGTLLIDGIFFRKNMNQSMHVIQMEEQRARKQNVYSRIIMIKRDKNPIMIKTTNTALAIQIGKEFKRAFHGKLDISPRRDNTVVVRWVLETAPVQVAVDQPVGTT